MARELADELAFFNEHLEEYQRDYAGRHLLIHGKELCGHFDTLDAAIVEGVRLFGAGPFLARRAGETTMEASVPALTLGVPLVADSHHPV